MACNTRVKPKGAILYLATFLSAVLLFVAACATHERRVYPQASWYSRMHQLSEAHLRLYPEVSIAQRFAEPSQHDAIGSEIAKLAGVTRELAEDPVAPNSDPLIEYTAQALAADVATANESFLGGDLPRARALLAHTGRHCISCHTRADRGTQDYPLRWTPSLANLSLAQKTEFSLANRQYQSGLQFAMDLAADSNSAQIEFEAWFASIKNAMAVLVRVRQSPEESEAFVRRAAANQQAPAFVRTLLAGWLRDIAVWKKSRLSADPAKQLRQAEVLLGGKARRGSYIAYLRASQILHSLLEHPGSKIYGEALLNAGVAARGLEQSRLAGKYFLTCIDESLHSIVAEICLDEVKRMEKGGELNLNLGPAGWQELEAKALPIEVPEVQARPKTHAPTPDSN